MMCANFPSEMNVTLRLHRLLSTVQEALIIADVYNTLVAGLIDPCKLASKISW